MLTEFLSFVFIPILFLGLYNLFNEEKKDWLLVIGSVGLIITHNLMTLICAIISLIYVATKIPMLKIKEIRKKLLINSIFIILISGFYWLPFLEASVSSQYEVYEPGKMATIESVQDKGISLKNLFITYKDSIYVYEFGFHILVLLCFSVVAFRRIIPKMKKEYIFWLIIGILSTFMATKYFPWKYLGEKVSFIQFPWRMLTLSSFCFSFICAINVGIIIKKFKYRDAIILSTIGVLYVCALNFIPLSEDGFVDPKDVIYSYVSGRNTDCIAGCGKNEYLPKNAYDNYFYLANRENKILVLEGNAEIKDYNKNGNLLTAKVEIVGEDPALLEFPYVYYPGYKVTLDGSAVSNFETVNGFLAIGLKGDSKGDLKVEYTGTSLSKFAKFFSIVSIIAFGVYVIFIKFFQKKT